jgi:hypothetical protein
VSSANCEMRCSSPLAVIPSMSGAPRIILVRDSATTKKASGEEGQPWGNRI